LLDSNAINLLHGKKEKKKLTFKTVIWDFCHILIVVYLCIARMFLYLVYSLYFCMFFGDYFTSVFRQINLFVWLQVDLFSVLFFMSGK